MLRDQIFEDQDFWVDLEFRFSGDCAKGAHLPQFGRHFWCDGFSPHKSINTRFGIQISGKAWIVDGQAQYVWDFVIDIPQNQLHRPLNSYDYSIQSACFDTRTLKLQLSKVTRKDKAH